MNRLKVEDFLPTIHYTNYTLPISKKKVKLRPLLMKELKILLSNADDEKINFLDTIIQVLENCINEKFDIMELSYVDFCFLYVELRKISKGSTINLTLNCGNKKCDNQIKNEYEISKIIEIEGKEQDNIIKITSDVGLELEMEKVRYKRERLEKKGKDPITDFSLITSHVKGIIKGEERFEEWDDEFLDSFLNRLSKEKYVEILQWFVNSKHIIMKIEYECEVCKNKGVAMEVDLINFFRLY